MFRFKPLACTVFLCALMALPQSAKAQMPHVTTPCENSTLSLQHFHNGQAVIIGDLYTDWHLYGIKHDKTEQTDDVLHLYYSVVQPKLNERTPMDQRTVHVAESFSVPQDVNFVSFHLAPEDGENSLMISCPLQPAE